MKKIYKIITLCFCIMFGLVVLVACDKDKEPQIPLTAVENGVTYTYFEQENAYGVTGFNDSAANVVIKAQLNEKPVVSIKEGAFNNLDSMLQSVTIPNTVKYIEESAFALCDKLGTVTFETNSTLERIGKSSFSGNRITAIEIPNSVKYIEESAFLGCDYLSSVTFQNGSNLEIIDRRAFAGTNIESIIIPNTVTSIEHEAFAACDLLTVSFNNGTQKLKRIAARAFYGCRYLQNVKIPNSIEYIGTNAFERSIFLNNNLSKCIQCYNGEIASQEYVFIKAGSQLESLEDIDNFEKVRVIANSAFESAKLEVADMGDCSKLITIGDMAFYEPQLKSIVIPASVKYIGVYAISLWQYGGDEFILTNFVIEGPLSFVATKYDGSVGNDEYFEEYFASNGIFMQFSVDPTENSAYLSHYIGYKFERS